MRPSPWTRRDLLQRGGLGLLGLGAAAGGLWIPRARADAQDPPLHLVLVTALGGWDVSYALDPKPGSPLVDGPELDEDPNNPEDQESVRTFGSLDVMTNPVKRPAVSRFFSDHADRAAIVRGLWVGSISHDACLTRVMTGRQADGGPDLAAMVADGVGRDAPIPYMDLGGASFAGPLAALSGRAGRNRQLRHLLDRRLALTAPEGSGVRYPQYVPTPVTRDEMAAVQALRDARFVEAWEGRAGSAQRLADLADARAREARLRDQGGRLADQLGAGEVGTMNGQVDTALDLLSGGMAHTVLVDSGGNWDTHDTNAEQHALYETLFAGLNRLAVGLDDAGLLDRTVVAVVSEMTRTPRRNAAAGKDHWPVTSMLLFGGPVAGDSVIGGTDDGLDALPIDTTTGLPSRGGQLLRYDQVAAAVVAGLGGRASDWFPGLTPAGGLFR